MSATRIGIPNHAMPIPSETNQYLLQLDAPPLFDFESNSHLGEEIGE